MVKSSHIKATKFLTALFLIGVAHIALGSFTGSTDENSKNKYSLKKFNKTFYKTASPFSLRASFQYKSTLVVGSQKEASGVTYNSLMRFEKGNTTYIYPYKHTVNVPRFKAPAPPTVR